MFADMSSLRRYFSISQALNFGKYTLLCLLYL